MLCIILQRKRARRRLRPRLLWENCFKTVRKNMRYSCSKAKLNNKVYRIKNLVDAIQMSFLSRTVASGTAAASSRFWFVWRACFDVNHAIWLERKQVKKIQRLMKVHADDFCKRLQPKIKLSNVHTTCDAMQKLKMQSRSRDYGFLRIQCDA